MWKWKLTYCNYSYFLMFWKPIICIWLSVSQSMELTTLLNFFFKCNQPKLLRCSLIWDKKGVCMELWNSSIALHGIDNAILALWEMKDYGVEPEIAFAPLISVPNLNPWNAERCQSWNLRICNWGHGIEKHCERNCQVNRRKGYPRNPSNEGSKGNSVLSNHRDNLKRWSNFWQVITHWTL